MPEIKLSSLRDKYAGRPAAVLGGGPSLPGDLARVPEGALLIAVNYHALKLVQPDYMVFNDDPDGDPRQLEAVRMVKAFWRWQTTLVSPGKYSDVEFDVPAWTGFLSSNTAAWLALWMGCDPVILCGMDCYQGERVYFHEYSHDCPAFHYPLGHYTRPWIEEGRHLLPGFERIRAMSGPLASIFGLYEERA